MDENIEPNQNNSEEQEQVQIQKELLQKPEQTEHEQTAYEQTEREQTSSQQQYQQQYQQTYQQGNTTEIVMEKPVGVGEWMLTTLVMMIPVVNIIMMFVWAFSSKTKKSKSNYFKATLIWALIWICVIAVISIALVIVGIIYYSAQF
jgi:hypothetical protein